MANCKLSFPNVCPEMFFAEEFSLSTTYLGIIVFHVLNDIFPVDDNFTITIESKTEMNII